MKRVLVFSQYTRPESLTGWMRRKHFRSCDRCGAAVHLDDLTKHARFHHECGDLGRYNANPSRTENGGNRTVWFDDELAEVRRS